MAIILRQVEADEIDALFPILLQAEASENALRWSLGHLSDTVYRAEESGQMVGAATMRWNSEPCEIIELAVVEALHRRGFGRQILELLLVEARRRGIRQMLVGTGNASIGNIVFYQKCGFRMDHIRRDYFWYHHEPEFENGILVRDMLVFRYDLADLAPQ